MPYFKIKTNIKLDALKTQILLEKASAFSSNILEKPETYIMAEVDAHVPMIFNKSSEPAAYVELKSIGLKKDNAKTLSKKICAFLKAELEISPDRVYIDFCNIDGSMFGWNKTTF